MWLYPFILAFLLGELRVLGLSSPLLSPLSPIGPSRSASIGRGDPIVLLPSPLGAASPQHTYPFFVWGTPERGP